MSIQQNINQLIGLAATAGTLGRSIKQQGLALEEQKKQTEQSKPENIAKAQHEAAVKKNLEKKTALQDQLAGAEKARASAKTDEERLEISNTIASIYDSYEEVLREQFSLEPNANPNIFKDIAGAKTRGDIHRNIAKIHEGNITAEKERQMAEMEAKMGLAKAIQEGQAKVQNKQQTEDFQKKVGVREQIGFKPLSEHRDFRRRLNNDTE